MATPNIVPRADQEGGLGTAAKSWGKLFIENATAGGTAAVTVSNLDIDQVALDINANNTTANVLDIASTALTTGNVMNVDCNGLTTGSAINLDIDDALTTSASKSLVNVIYNKSGDTASGQSCSTIGLNISLEDDATSNVGTITSTGVAIDIDAADADGTVNQTGVSVTLANGDAATTNSFQSVCLDGGNDFLAKSSANNLDYFTLATTTNGATTLSTVDASHALAHFEVAADGDINLGSTTNKINKTYDFHGTTFENTYTDDQGSGTILKYSPGADESPAGSELFFLHTDGTWNQTDADAVATGGSQLLAVGLGAAARTTGVLLEGFVKIASTEILNTPGGGAVDGLPLYVSTTAGHFDFTAPSGSGDFVRIVGYAIDDDSSDVLVYFKPDSTFVELT